jgi:hypothetical protein
VAKLTGGLPPMSFLDRCGVTLSCICLVHCVALPLVIALLPAIATASPRDGWVHPVMIGFALPISGLALYRGYRTHRQLTPLLSGCAGLVLLGVGIMGQGMILEPIATVGGGLLIAAAHLTNWRRHLSCDQACACDRDA